MQIVSLGDNLHKMSNPVSPENKKKYFKILSAENCTQKLLKNGMIFFIISLNYCWQHYKFRDMIKNYFIFDPVQKRETSVTETLQVVRCHTL